MTWRSLLGLGISGGLLPCPAALVLLLAAAAVTVVSDNLLALSGIWVATDVLLVARARGSSPVAGSAPTGLVASGSLLMLLAIGITSLDVASTSLAAADLPPETLALLLLAAASAVGYLGARRASKRPSPPPEPEPPAKRPRSDKSRRAKKRKRRK